MVSAAKLQVEFQPDVGQVLRIRPRKLRVEYADVENAFFDIAYVFDPVVDRSHDRLWNDHEKQLRSFWVDGKPMYPVVDLGFDLLRGRGDMHSLHIVANRYPELSEFLLEFVQLCGKILVTSPGIASTLQRNAKVGPRGQICLCNKFHGSHVPASKPRRGHTRPGISDRWDTQNSAWDCDQLRRYIDIKRILCERQLVLAVDKSVRTSVAFVGSNLSSRPPEVTID